jgi:hypothetical protein
MTGPECCEECPGDSTCEHNDVCMCGSYMRDHDDMYMGHSAVSMHDYYSRPPKKRGGDDA